MTKYLLIEETNKRSFTIYQRSELRGSFVVARSIDYTKPDGSGFDQQDYDLAKEVAQRAVDLLNK